MFAYLSELQELIEEETILNSSVFLGIMENESTSPAGPYFALDISYINDHLFKIFHPDADALVDRRGVFTLGNVTLTCTFLF